MIVEVFPNLFVGDADGIPEAKKRGMFIIHAAKEPWHRERLGYKGKAAPQDDHRYLYDANEDEMWCNLVDAHDVKYIPNDLVASIFTLIHRKLYFHQDVFIHCNKGESRAPTMALCYLLKVVPDYTVEKFKQVYPAYAPGKGMAAYLERFIDNL